MKGQISLEIIITLGVVLSFTIPILLLLLSVSQLGYEKSSLLQADAAAGILADSINDVYSQGPGAKRLLSLTLPTNTESVSISGKEIVIKLKVSNGYYDAVSPIAAKVKNVTLSRGGSFVAILRVNNDLEVEVS